MMLTGWLKETIIGKVQETGPRSASGSPVPQARFDGRTSPLHGLRNGSIPLSGTLVNSTGERVNANRVAEIITEYTHTLWRLTLLIYSGDDDTSNRIEAFEAWRILTQMIDKFEQPSPPILTEEMLWFARQSVLAFSDLVAGCDD